jgi:predicted anti-sigma-YlaC factor YlaD
LRLDGPLSELDELRLDAHLGTCAECRAYALDVAAIAALVQAAPLEQPSRPVFGPARRRQRRPVVRLQLAAAAVLLLAAVTGSSFALGRALGGHGPVTVTATAGSADVLSLRADSTQQHLLAMIDRIPLAGASIRIGKAVAL